MTRHIAALLAALIICAPAAAESAHDLLVGETRDINPRYLLQDPNGRSITNEDFSGRFQLIAFGYTYCPDVCPTTLVEMAAILKALGDQADRLQPIFITIDPERDTAKVLKTYTEFFDPRIIGLTGSPALVRRAADNFKIRYAKVSEPGAKNYAMDHSAGMILLGPDGRFIKKFAFAMPVEQITTQLVQIMGEYPVSPARR
jgi:protein SCO1/2